MARSWPPSPLDGAEEELDEAASVLPLAARTTIPALRARLDAARRATEGTAEPDARRGAAEEARLVRQAVATLCSRPEVRAALLRRELNSQLRFFDRDIRPAAPPAAAARADQLASSVRAELDGGTPDGFIVADSLIREINTLYWGEGLRMPGFCAMYWRWMRVERHLMRDKERFDTVLEAGDRAVGGGRHGGLRDSLRAMWRQQDRVGRRQRRIRSRGRAAGVMSAFPGCRSAPLCRAARCPAAGWRTAGLAAVRGGHGGTVLLLRPDAGRPGGRRSWTGWQSRGCRSPWGHACASPAPAMRARIPSADWRCATRRWAMEAEALAGALLAMAVRQPGAAGPPRCSCRPWPGACHSRAAPGEDRRAIMLAALSGGIGTDASLPPGWCSLTPRWISPPHGPRSSCWRWCPHRWHPRGRTGGFVLPGQPALEALLREQVLDVLHRPAEYARLGVAWPGGVLLAGPPGCGKSFAAARLAALPRLDAARDLGRRRRQHVAARDAAAAGPRVRTAQPRTPGDHPAGGAGRARPQAGGRARPGGGGG